MFERGRSDGKPVEIAPAPMSAPWHPTQVVYGANTWKGPLRRMKYGGLAARNTVLADYLIFVARIFRA